MKPGELNRYQGKNDTKVYSRLSSKPLSCTVVLSFISKAFTLNGLHRKSKRITIENKLLFSDE